MPNIRTYQISTYQNKTKNIVYIVVIFIYIIVGNKIEKKIKLIKKYFKWKRLEINLKNV